MVALSTVWGMKQGARTAAELLAPILRMGLEAVELDFRITPELLEELLPSLRNGAPRAVSLHNFCPVPDPLPPYKASGDAFNLASLDAGERKEAVRWTCRTLEMAHELEVRTVVLHLGYMEMDDELKPHEAFREGRWGQEELERYLALRASRAPRHLDAILLCLEPILKRAESLGVEVGIENRYHLHEFPLGEEIGRILEEFSGAPIGYWHDVGHAHVLETLGAVKHRELLERYCQRIVGVHLHDADGLKDHLPPGKGSIDFDMVRDLLPEGVVKVMEIHPPATKGEIIEGLEFLKQKGIL